MRSNSRNAVGLGMAVLISLLLSACNLPATAAGASVWLDVPLDGLTFPAIQEINIEGHATGSGGVSRVEIWINGTLLTTHTRPPMTGDLATFQTSWTPAEAGTYTIQAVAYGADGTASQPDAARITIGAAATAPACPSPVGGGPTPVSCGPTLVAACPSPVGGGPTPPPPCVAPPVGCPSPVGGGPTPVSCGPTLPVVTIITPTGDVRFWAEPAEIAAGECTDIRWQATNVSDVVFGGISQPLEGSYEACLCDDERYSLNVTYLDGRTERLTLDIPVEGTCVTEVPADTTPPPVPQPAVPANGLTLSCRSSQVLAWLPVSDPSTPVSYRFHTQRHSGDGNWQNAPSGTGAYHLDKQVTVPVECGWYYRWNVGAEDGAGNKSGYSDWSEFTVSLE